MFGLFKTGNKQPQREIFFKDSANGTVLTGFMSGHPYDNSINIEIGAKDYLYKGDILYNILYDKLREKDYEVGTYNVNKQKIISFIPRDLEDPSDDIKVTITEALQQFVALANKINPITQKPHGFEAAATEMTDVQLRKIIGVSLIDGFTDKQIPGNGTNIKDSKNLGGITDTIIESIAQAQGVNAASPLHGSHIEEAVKEGVHDGLIKAGIIEEKVEYLEKRMAERIVRAIKEARQR